MHARAGRRALGLAWSIVESFESGRRVATVDLDRPTVTKRKLVWAKNWGEAKKHKVVVKPVNSFERVEFDGFFVLR